MYSLIVIPIFGRGFLLVHHKLIMIYYIYFDAWYFFFYFSISFPMLTKYKGIKSVLFHIMYMNLNSLGIHPIFRVLLQHITLNIQIIQTILFIFYYVINFVFILYNDIHYTMTIIIMLF